MKTFTRNLLFSLALLLGSGAVLRAQSPVPVLNSVIADAASIGSSAAANGAALKALVVEYFVLGNPSPDIAAFDAATNTQQNLIESLQDDIAVSFNLAASLDSYINPTRALGWCSQIEALGDAILAESALLSAALLAGDDVAATASALQIRADLLQQNNLARELRREATYYKQAQQAYNVRILLEDYLGNPVTGSTGLMGYYAYNVFTGEYVYPDYYHADEFSDLRAGTWTFGAYPGYFDGASTRTVTLSASLEGPDGFIPVTLQYWSE